MTRRRRWSPWMIEEAARKTARTAPASEPVILASELEATSGRVTLRRTVTPAAFKGSMPLTVFLREETFAHLERLAVDVRRPLPAVVASMLDELVRDDTAMEAGRE